MTTYNLIAIDIAKDSLQVQEELEGYPVANDPSGRREFLRRIKKQPNPLVICEATGGYERDLLEDLRRAAVPYRLVNPSRVRAFAASEGIKAKSDPIDAEVILRFAREKRLQPMPAPSEAQLELAALLDRRSHLSEHIAREKNRLQNSSRLIHDSIKRMLAFLEKELLALEAAIHKQVQSDPSILARFNVLQSVSGVGKVTAWTLLAYLSEISTLNRNRLVALAGIAPYNRDSGKTSAKRSIFAGRSKVRKCLYMAAQTAATHNPVIRPYVSALIARGKPYKCALVAAMRKLLIHLQSLIKKIDLCPCS